jgi:EAL domain-containing protein (putative c-di-GMP-specific phosphodiesterase class I)
VLTATANSDFEYDHPVALDRGGITQCSSSGPSRIGAPVPDPEFFGRVVATAGFTVGTYGIGQVSGNELIRVGYPVVDGAGAVVGAVYAGINLTWLNTAIDQWKLGEGVSVDIVDRNGILIARYPNSRGIGHPISDNLKPFLVGITLYGPEASDAETLLSNADIALYRAKSEGRGTYRFFTDAMDDEVRRRVALESELRAAIETGQLFLLYQPQIDIETGRITGLEAVIRWNHPEHGEIAADAFVPTAERSGLVVALGHWMMREACRQTRAWLDAGIAPCVVAMNVSHLQFKTPMELERDIATILMETGLAPDRIELEVTESVVTEASREHNDVLVRLRQSGLRLAIDDFGTGYSSLGYLRQFPVDRIKIAQLFIRDLRAVADYAAIVKATIGLALALDLNVIATGVETAEQLELLRAWGCRAAQGAYFAPPLPPDAITELLRRGRVAPWVQPLPAEAAA